MMMMMMMNSKLWLAGPATATWNRADIFRYNGRFGLVYKQPKL